MTPAKLKERRARFQKLDRALKKLFPNVGTELVYKTPWQFMVAVQLSAQCTDRRVNMVTKELFKRYKTIDDYAKADLREFENAIGSVTYYHNKARNIINAAKFVKKEFNGVLPKTMSQMTSIPGVGRKTANVVLADIYGITPGITVDTHVIRFVSRFGLSDYRDAVRIERDLMQIVPEKEWRLFTHRVIHYGRYLAPARAYDLSKDPLVKIYPPAAKKFRV
ncbi:MAG TPA: endonuclease III [Candidatus Paceibacterota bacterium]|nr:endonuclease III [Candidatus Paceibacterota bacterium]